jgi:hypothetical protein
MSSSHRLAAFLTAILIAGSSQAAPNETPSEWDCKLAYNACMAYIDGYKNDPDPTLYNKGSKDCFYRYEGCLLKAELSPQDTSPTWRPEGSVQTFEQILE